MSYIIVALGNPGEEYAMTRHNTGRIIADAIAKQFSFGEFKENPKIKSLVAKGEIGPLDNPRGKKESVQIIEPNNFMNRSGASLSLLLGTAVSKQKAHKIIVIYDDLDLPLGKIKISFNKSSGGHRGLESIIKALKTEEFIRIRVGISPVTSSGKIKKPSGEVNVEKHIIGEYKKPELDILKKVAKDVVHAVSVIITCGKDAAMGQFN